MLKRIGAEESGEFKAIASGTLPSGKPVVVNADGTVSVPSVTAQNIGSFQTFDSDACSTFASVYDTNSDRLVITYKDGGNSSKSTAIVGTVSGSSISFGTPVVIDDGGEVEYRDITFDSSNNKVVVIYKDDHNSNYATAIVGTVDSSDNSISFGTEVVFNSANTTAMSVTFDSNANKVIVVYRGGSNQGKAKVGTVSGTGISFGSEATFNAGTTTTMSAAFDSTNNKVVVGYRDQGDSNKGNAVVGTVSGTDITFGSEATFEDGAVLNVEDTISIAHDSTNDRIVIAYTDNGNSNSGTAVVGTVSGTDITFGTPVVFETVSSGNGVYYNSIVFNPSASKVVITYHLDFSNSFVIVGTVSGTSITFNTAVNINGSSTSQVKGQSASVYDPDSEKVILPIRDTSDSNKGKATVFTTQSTNLTSENYIGMSKGGAVADTKGATVDIIGAVNDEQSGLTAGQQYYVQTDGTIGTTADSPSVLAGTAISATELLVKT